ncbi:MAG: hemolysin III family protein, partial [Clostridia bacterium]|nr:hemolysin III family protein [Clostridia bacterium]
GGFGVITLAVCVMLAAMRDNVAGIVCSAIFGASMIVLYTASSLYHGIRREGAKKVFQILDHCTIYFLIAGTYTPMLLCSLIKVAPTAAILTLIAVWSLAILAITLTAIDLHKYKAFSMVCYIAIGWAIIFSIRSMYAALTSAGFWLLLSGGIVYTLGAVLFKVGKHVKYFHSIFHLFVLAGSVLHTLCIVFYVL